MTQVSSPAVPPSMEERLFTDWSSEGSLRGRGTPQIQSAISVASRRNINQEEQTVRAPEDGKVISTVMTTSSARVQIDQVGVKLVDRETNTSVVDIRPLREEVRTDIIHACSKGIQVPSSESEISSQDAFTEESVLRP